MKIELNRIYRSGARHGYSHKFMHKLYLQQKDKIREDFYDVAQVQSDERPLSLPGQVDRIALPYKTHEYKTLAKALKKSNTKCTYKRPPTIFSLLRNDKKKRKSEFDSGVYRIPVDNIQDQRREVYVGTTKRNFRDRLNEHKNNIQKGIPATALAQRAFEKDKSLMG